MPHCFQKAPSGRAKCRACKKAISKGDYRLGEEVPNAFGEGTAMHWYHVECGARQRAEAYLTAWEAFKLEPGDVEDKETRSLLEKGDVFAATAELGKTYYRLQRFIKVEPAPSGRARCQACRELIEKGALRFVLQRIEDGMVSGAGFIHVGCAHAYAGAVDELLARVRDLSELEEESWSEVERAVAEQEQLPREVKIPYGSSADEDDNMSS